MSDGTSELIVRMSAARAELLDQARTGKGLASMERAQIIATIDDIDAGRIAGRAQLPELMWADEITRSEVDSRRIGVTADRLATATKEAITQRIEATGAIEPGSRAEDRLTKDVDSIGSVVRVVVNGSQSTSLDRKRAAFVERRGRLEQDLAQAGVQVAARAEIRGLVDARGKEAGQLGQSAAVRREQWQTRTAQAVTARDTAAARRAAVDAGEARPAERACATPPTRTAGQAASTGRGARIAQLHTQEVGR
ncbi:hypothetical protein ABIA39_006962 [Nocardia sp. GAS34]|uniref:hypothetical protein n=1 Tax=unclassified Nocardia TaxID=2637762 RepID=UPI003D1C53D5